MTVQLLEGHVVDVLAGLPAGHFHCAVTSPPYLWLRAYGTEGQTWDGVDGCEHEWGEEGHRNRGGQIDPDRVGLLGHLGGNVLAGRNISKNSSSGQWCTRCGAWRGELGQEPSPELYVDHLVAVFRAVKRVLRADGTLWVNLAGCYYNDPGGQNGASLRNGEGASTLHGANPKLGDLHRISRKTVEANATLGRQKRGRHPWLKPLDWVDVPGLFAQAMQRDGWTWRSDVVWVKPSALPESVSGTKWERCRVKTAEGKSPARNFKPELAGSGIAERETAEWADCPGCQKCAANEGLVLRRGSGRPTKATERVLLFVKGPGYWFEQEAVREALTESSIARLAGDVESQEGSWRAHGGAKTNGPMRAVGDPARGRNLRDWWVIGPSPLKDEHYAAYPPELPSRCIRAGTSEWGCCPSCGAPWARVMERGQATPDPRCWSPKGQRVYDDATGGMVEVSPDVGSTLKHVVESSTLGWRPTCRCLGVAEQAPVPCRVLDPFGGSGSTALAANRLGRDCTLVELKPQYNALTRKRLGREPLSLFAWKPEGTPATTPEEVEV